MEAIESPGTRAGTRWHAMADRTKPRKYKGEISLARDGTRYFLSIRIQGNGMNTQTHTHRDNNGVERVPSRATWPPPWLSDVPPTADEPTHDIRLPSPSCRCRPARPAVPRFAGADRLPGRMWRFIVGNPCGETVPAAGGSSAGPCGMAIRLSRRGLPGGEHRQASHPVSFAIFVRAIVKS